MIYFKMLHSWLNLFGLTFKRNQSDSVHFLSKYCLLKSNLCIFFNINEYRPVFYLLNKPSFSFLFLVEPFNLSFFIIFLMKSFLAQKHLLKHWRYQSVYFFELVLLPTVYSKGFSRYFSSNFCHLRITSSQWFIGINLYSFQNYAVLDHEYYVPLTISGIF